MNSTDFGFQIAPWELRWCGLDLEALHRTEPIFALSNGHIGLRGTFEDGEPVGAPGTYLNGYYERRALPYAEGGYGYPEDGQTVVNVTDGKIIRLFVQDSPMDMRYGRAVEHERVLDFRAGSLRRNTVWMSPTGLSVRIRSERLVSFTQRAIAAIRSEVQPLDADLDLVVQSGLLANEPVPTRSNDPRLAAALDRPLVADFSAVHGFSAVLAHHTKHSGLRMAAGMDHALQVNAPADCSIASENDLARLTIAVDVAKGDVLQLTKFIAYGWSSRRSTQALWAQVDAALAKPEKPAGIPCWHVNATTSMPSGHTPILRSTATPNSNRRCASRCSKCCKRAPRSKPRYSAKGLTGPGYDGHAFWDTEILVLPMLTHTMPDAAADALRWRYSTLDKAKRARANSVIPERCSRGGRINGDECSGYWPAGTAAVHVSADIAYATAQYIAATGDERFETECGVELLVETARLWASLGHHHTSGEFRIDGVTGPDEYSALADNNLFTNLMAQQNLRDAADACCRHADVARRLQVTDEEATDWRDCADHMMVPYNTELGVHEQAETSPTKPSGTSPRHQPPTIRCCCITHTLSCTANRSSNRPTSPWRCTCAVTPSPPTKRPETSTITKP